MTTQPSSPFSAIVLAGDRSHLDPLLQHTGAPCKALVTLGGEPMLLRVLRTLQESTVINQLLLSGPEKHHLKGQGAINTMIDEGCVHWLSPQSTPSSSTYQALQQVPESHPALLTTADHAFLNTTIIDTFCQQSLAQQADVVVGLAPYEQISKAFPTLKKTVLRFKDGAFCGCNLFAFMTPKGRQAAHYWRQMEQQRKHPIKLIKWLGWGTAIRYALGRLTLDDALARLSALWKLRLSAVILPFPEAAIDVDSVADYEAITSIL